MNKLREKRNEMGITQVEAAALCGVSRRAYQYYEEDDTNKVLDELIETLNKSLDDFLNIKKIKEKCSTVFLKYPEIKCAYLYVSYARKETTSKSDVDILVVSPPMGLKFYGIAAELEKELKRSVDLQTHRQLLDNAEFVEAILTEGIKIYG